MVLMLLSVMIPVDALSPPVLPPGDALGVEVVLISESGFSGADWVGLEEMGVQPLRPLDQTRLLVWLPSSGSVGRSSETVATSIDGHRVSDGMDEMGAYDGSFEVGLVQRVLFEPHLPVEGMRQALDMLVEGGFILDDGFDARDGGAMPAWVTGRTSGDDLSDIAGILRIEPVLKTRGRNEVSASLMEDGRLDDHSLWNLGLNGSGLLIAIADSGIDLDHACFRDEVGIIGTPGDAHRKVQLINTTIDDWDDSGDQDFGHGTHIAGTLACEWIGQDGEYPDGTSPSHGARLLMQDIVGDDGWLPPDDSEWLFLEAAQNGAVIHSDSWGDDTAEYTKRSGDFDAWAREVPWSLIFVAPGNTGGQLLEPANARNVIAVGATSKTEEMSMLSSSSIGPTAAGTRGIFLVAPGQSIISAKADGVVDSLNGDTSMKSGTSMSTPLAASGAAIIQQLVEDGWITGGDALNNTNISLADGSQITLMLGEGFTPSGPLLKALLSLSTTPLVNTTHGGGELLGNGPDSVQGWGVLNISELIDFNGIESAAGSNESIDPGAGIWIVDSYRMDGWSDFSRSRAEGVGRPLDVLGQNPWNGSGAAGPFISTGEETRWNFSLDGMSPLDVRLSWLAKPAPYPIDDLRLSVILPDGRVAHGSDFSDDGWTDLRDGDQMPADFDNETTTGVSISTKELAGVEWVHVVVRANYVSAGSSPGTLGVEGDRLGFGLVVKGIEQNLPVVVQGGALLDISIGGVIGYQFSPRGGGDQVTEMMGEPITLGWDFESQPGGLFVALSPTYPRTLSTRLSNSDLGFEQLSGAPIGISLPRCEQIESVNPLLTYSREWNWSGVWWPPDIAGCRGNSVEFMLEIDDSNPPEALNEWESWRKNITDGDGLVIVRVVFNLSEWQHPWAQGDSVPELGVCEYRFTHEDWSSCDLFVGDLVEMPPDAYSLEVRMSWVENGGLDREFIITHEISPFNAVEPSGLEFDVLEGVVTIISGTVPTGGWPVVLIRTGDDSAYVEFIDDEWGITPASCEEEQSSYLLMVADSFSKADINSFGSAPLEDSGLLTVDGISLDGNWTYALIGIQDDVWLQLYEVDRGWDLVVPLVLQDEVVLDNRCIEEKSDSTFMGVFWVWLILTIVIIISIFAVWRRKAGEVDKLGIRAADEES